MSYAAGAGAAAAARAAAIAKAIKASGTIVRVDPDDFLTILNRVEKPLVVMTSGGTFKKNYQYLTSYKGLTFFAKSAVPLMLPGSIELITAREIWIP